MKNEQYVKKKYGCDLELREKNKQPTEPRSPPATAQSLHATLVTLICTFEVLSFASDQISLIA